MISPDWIKELSWVLLGIRTAPKEDLGCLSAEIVYGTLLTVPEDFIARGSFNSDLQLHIYDNVRSLVPCGFFLDH